jgi:cytochrome P450
MNATQDVGVSGSTELHMNFTSIAMTIFIAVCVVYVTNNRRKSGRKAVPRPAWYRAWQLDADFAADPLKTIEKLHKEFGDIFLFRNEYVLSDYKDIRLVTEGDHRQGIPMSDKIILKPNLSESVFKNCTMLFYQKTTDEKFHISRKAAAGAFSDSNLRDFFNTEMRLVMEKTLSVIADYAKTGKSFDVHETMTRFTNDLALSQMGAPRFVEESAHNTGSSGQKLGNMITTIHVENICKARSLIYRYKFWSDAWSRKVAAAVEGIEGLVRESMVNCRARERRPLIIDEIMRSEKYPSDKQRGADIIMQYLALEGTTTTTPCLAMWQILTRKPVLDKIRAEIDAAAADVPADKLVPRDTIAALPYLDMVLQETQRLHMTVPFITQRTNDVDLHFGDYVIPKGSIIKPFHGMASKNPKYLSDADEFVPTRWAADNPELPLLEQMSMPFGSGKRNCSGRRLAQLVIKQIIVELFRRYDIEIVDEAKVEKYFHVMSKLRNFNVRVRERR